MNLGNSIILSSTQNINTYYDLKKQIFYFESSFMNRIIVSSAIAHEISLRVEV